MISKWRNMKTIEQIRQCRANVMEIVSAIEAYKVSNDFLPRFGYLEEGHMRFSPITSEDLKNINLPDLCCPFGTFRQAKKNGDLTDDIMKEWNKNDNDYRQDCCYGLRSIQNGFTISCYMHRYSKSSAALGYAYATWYEHPIGKSPGWCNPKELLDPQNPEVLQGVKQIQFTDD